MVLEARSSTIYLPCMESARNEMCHAPRACFRGAAHNTIAANRHVDRSLLADAKFSDFACADPEFISRINVGKQTTRYCANAARTICEIMRFSGRDRGTRLRRAAVCALDLSKDRVRDAAILTFAFG